MLFPDVMSFYRLGRSLDPLNSRVLRNKVSTTDLWYQLARVAESGEQSVQFGPAPGSGVSQDTAESTQYLNNVGGERCIEFGPRDAPKDEDFKGGFPPLSPAPLYSKRLSIETCSGRSS